MNSEAPDGTKPMVWFLDTSALVTLAVHPPLQRAVVATLSAHRRVLTTAVFAELEGLAKTAPPTSNWAAAVLADCQWLGQAVPLDDPAGTRLAVEIQEELAAGRSLKHNLEHYGEAAIISMASRARTLQPLMLSDDYNARVAAKRHGVQPLSVHKLIHIMITQQKITASQASGFADALNKAGRALDYTAAELTAGKLGRVGQP
jgi:hypothetical protein